MLISSCAVFLPFTKRCAHNGTEPKNSCKHMFFAVSACFAAGLLMSISVLHILPESNEMYEGVLAKWEAAEEAEHALELLNDPDHAGESEADHAEEDHGDEDNDHAGESEEEHDEHEGHGGHAFPLPFVLFQAGFFIMLLMNLIFHAPHSPGEDDGHSHGPQAE